VADARIYSIELAFRRLRLGVLGCCWIVSLALAVQLVIWSLARYTDMRYETSVATAPPAQVVTAGNDAAVGRLRPSTPIHTSAMAATDEPAVNPNQLFSKYDEYFRQGSMLTSAIGKLGFMMLMPLLAVGVFLSAGSGASGVHKSVSAFTWSLVLAMLVLPVGTIVNWPALAGAFYDYEVMVAGVDASQQTIRDADAVSQSAGMYFARYLMLPAVCLVGVILVSFRFSLGVEASLLFQETRQFDPALEREASNRSATSLHAGGGRSAGALTRTIGSPMPPAPSSPAVARMNTTGEDRMPTATKVAAGEAPRRLI
jgi:hypothetical protein